MEKKRLNTILITVVAGLWGYNIYKTIENEQLSDEYLQATIDQSNNITPILFKKDSFDLELAQVDPFLKTNRFKRNSTTVQPQIAVIKDKKPKVIVPVKEEKKLEWPIIQYFGFVRNHDAKQPLSMLKVGNAIHKIKAGNSIDNIYVKAVFRDSISLIFEGETRNFLKK